MKVTVLPRDIKQGDQMEQILPGTGLQIALFTVDRAEKVRAYGRTVYQVHFQEPEAKSFYLHPRANQVVERAEP